MKDVDQVFAEAVQRGIVLGGTLDSNHEVDLSGMTFPVARAAVRFIFNRIKETTPKGEKAEGVALITGVGSQFTRAAPHESPGVDHEQPEATLSLRDYVQKILSEDLDLPISSIVPRMGPGTVEVTADAVKAWIEG
jgi:hypothetical protein